MGFHTARIQDINTLQDTMRRIIKRERKLFSVKMNLFIQGNMRVKKKEITKLCNKLSMKVDLPVEFNAEKCNLNFQSHIYQKKYIYI